MDFTIGFIIGCVVGAVIVLVYGALAASGEDRK